MKRIEPPSPLQPAAQPSGYARLARRLTACTSNLLATGIVLVLALGGGRQLVRWYREDPSPPDRTSSQPRLASPSSEPVALELVGGGYTLRRESVSGTIEVATDRLQRFCRSVLTAAATPIEPASRTERRFLDSLSRHPPVDEAAGQWKIYRLQGSMPIVVGVREGLRPEPDSGSTLAEPLRRVLAWAVAVPSGQYDWVLYQHQVESDGVTRTSEDLGVPIPADSRRTLTITGLGGERTIGIAGRGDPASWQRHFDRHFTGQGWQSRGWQTAGGGWHARYEHASGRIAEVHFAADRSSGLHGLMIVGPDNDEIGIEAT